MTKGQLLHGMGTLYERKGDGCWAWLKGTKSRGYGAVWFEGRGQSAHRVMYEITKGQIPDGMFVCHKCDNPVCVNPDHLFLGSPLANVQDCLSKDRFPIGDKHSAAKISGQDAMDIKKLIEAGFSHRKIASWIGVPKSCVTDISLGRTWGRYFRRLG